MRSFPGLAGKGSGNEFRLEKRIENSEKSMVQNSVFDHRFVNMSELGITNKEAFIATMPVTPIFQFFMQLKNILFEIFLKENDIGLFIFRP